MRGCAVQVLLVGAAIIALTLGVFIGAIAGAVRRRALASGMVLVVTGLTASIPSFFVAYFLQIAVIVFGANQVTGHSVPAGVWLRV